MLLKFFMFIIGFTLSSLSLTFLFLYLNILNIGYSFIEFINFIIKKWELYLFFIGIILMIISLRKGKPHDICLWFIN